VRSVQLYFPNLGSQVAALSEWFDRHLNPAGIMPAGGPDDLPRYLREIHAAGTAISSLIVRFMIVLPPKNPGIYPPANRLP
jgi:hypothetical protein